MKTKVCPYCDQPIKGRYCKGCKRVVLDPVEYEMTYYLNERHPDHEENCSYHGNTVQNSSEAGTNRNQASANDSVRSSDHRMTLWETEEKKAQIRERMEARKREQKNVPRKETPRKETQWAFISGKQESWNPSKETRKGSGAGKKIVLAFLIYLFIVFGSSQAVRLVRWGAETIIDGFRAGGVYETVIEPERSYEWERNVEEVQAAGEACTGYGHFSAVYTEEDGPELLRQLLDEAGFRVWEETVYNYNSEMTYDSWYQIVYSYTIETDEEYIGTIEIDTDTATGQIHGFSMYASEEEHFCGLADVVLNYMEMTGIAEETLPQGAEFYRELCTEHRDEIQEQGFALMYGMEAYCYLNSEDEADFFSMTLNAPGYRTEK